MNDDIKKLYEGVNYLRKIHFGSTTYIYGFDVNACKNVVINTKTKTKIVLDAIDLIHAAKQKEIDSQ